PEQLQPDLQATTKEGVIRELVDLMARAGRVTDADAAMKAVLEREAQLATGVGAGVAIPHGRTSAVKAMACAIGVKHQGIDFGSTDGEPTRIVVLVLTAEAGADPYMQFVASVMGVLDEEGRRRVLAAIGTKELYYVLTRPAGG
ncbi:MAG: PTS sugar transporter subunit IIA, partial [bacterium]